MEAVRAAGRWTCRHTTLTYALLFPYPVAIHTAATVALFLGRAVANSLPIAGAARVAYAGIGWWRDKVEVAGINTCYKSYHTWSLQLKSGSRVNFFF